MLLERFKTTLRELSAGLPFRPETLLIALSGGADSVTLLDLCLRLAREPGFPRLAAAHLHHDLRGPDADADAEFCRELCQRNEITFNLKRVDVAALARERGLGQEEAGRAARLEFFAELCELEPRTAVLLAHHLDDQAETVLLNLLRGRGPEGLCGMRGLRRIAMTKNGGEREVFLLRPLLAVPRSELRAYAQNRGLAWREDATNATTDYERNRLRHEALPLLEGLRPGLAGRLARLGELCAAEAEAFARLAGPNKSRLLRREREGLLLLCPAREPLPPWEETVALRLAREELARAPLAIALSHDDCTRLRELLRTETAGGELTLSGGGRARRETDGVFVFRKKNAAVFPPLTLGAPPPGRTIINHAGLELILELGEADAALRGDAAKNSDHSTERFDAGTLRWPLVLRAREEGDRMRPLGAPGSKKLKGLLIDRKIPQRVKEDCLVLRDADGPIWLWPVCVSDRTKLTPTTRAALTVTLRRRDD